MNQSYSTIIYKIDIDKIEDINIQNDNVIACSNPNLPLISLGFHNFILRTRNAMNITKNIEKKNEFYYVINPFESIIFNYEDNLIKLTQYYLNIDVINNSFYKLWEILFTFNIAENQDMTFAILSTNVNAFIQAITNFRLKIGIIINNDKIHILSFNNDDIDKIETSDKKSKHKNLSEINKIITKKIVKIYKNKDNINEIINSLKKEIDKTKKYADLLIADLGIDNEAEIYDILINEIITCLKIQKYDGSFIFKIFDTFTLPTLKLIYLMNNFFSEIYLYKPYFSRPSDSEKYIILKKFKYDQIKDSKFLNEKIKIFENILNNINKKYIYDIFPNLILPQDFINKFTFINTKLVNLQQIMINEIVKYIKENNYYGEKYHNYRENQIKAIQWWVSIFYPPSENLYLKNKNDINNIIKSTIEFNELELNKLSSQLSR